ncbi:hypothetical protein RZS08_48790, partial [Arthrospira platensis SPKY1]|nr:hypothetical protein [Arthrospira platensis SPKY1]
KGPLYGRGRQHRRQGIGKDSEETVAGRIDFPAVVLPQGFPDGLPVMVQYLGISGSEALEQGG